MLRRVAVAIAGTVLLAGCRPTADAAITEEQKTQVAEAVEARVSGYLDAIRRRDIDWMLDFWANTDGFVMAGDGQLTVGYDTYAQVLRDNMVTRPTVNSIAKSNEHIYVLAPDAASYSMEFEWSMEELRSR